MDNICGLPLHIAEEQLKKTGYEIELREVSSPRSLLYSEKRVLKAEISGNTVHITWASFPSLGDNKKEN